MKNYPYSTTAEIFNLAESKASAAGRKLSEWTKQTLTSYARHLIGLEALPSEIPLVSGDVVATINFRVSDAESALFKMLESRFSVNGLRWMSEAIRQAETVSKEEKTAVTQQEARRAPAVVTGRNDPLQITPFDAEEHEAVRNAARRAGITKAAWVRRTLKAAATWELSQK